MNNEKNQKIWIEKVHENLILRGRSERTFINYKSVLTRLTFVILLIIIFIDPVLHIFDLYYLRVPYFRGKGKIHLKF